MRPCNLCSTPVENAKKYCVDCEQQSSCAPVTRSANRKKSATPVVSDFQFVVVRLLQVSCGGILIGTTFGAMVGALCLCVMGLSMKVAIGIAVTVGFLAGGALVFSQMAPG